MTGERISAIFHFFDNGIYIECEDLDIGKFVSKGDGNAIMEVLNEIEDYSDPNTTFTLTKKGKKIAEEITSSFSDGVNYALSEYTKSLWHDSNEEPKDDVDILVLRPSGCTLIHHSSTINWTLFTKCNNIEKWCYVDDILQKKMYK